MKRVYAIRNGIRVVAVALMLSLAWAGGALAAGYLPGFYSGRTGQGRTITLEAAGGKVTNLYTEIVDNCRPGKTNDFLFPHPASISGSGRWHRRTPGNQPTIYNGRFTHGKLSGTIVDTINNRKGHACHGRTTFHASLSKPLTIGPATVGGRGTDVLLHLRMPPSSDGNIDVPYTSDGLLVYGSSTGCPASYAAADALARGVGADGFSGLITDAYVDADYGMQPYELAFRAFSHGVFTFHVATNTLLRDETGHSPFSTVCAMLYRGKPAPANPSANVALEQTSARLIAGRGIPDTQP